MRVGKFFVTMARKPRRIWFLHARSEPTEVHSSQAEHTVLYDPLWTHGTDLRQEISYQLSWIEQRRSRADPPATQILTELWPLDKRKFEEVLINMAKDELMLGRNEDGEFPRGD